MPNNPAISMAIAIVAEDPPVGIIPLNKGWNAAITAEGGIDASRRLSVSREGCEMTLQRFVRNSTKPSSWPDSIPFVGSEIAWAGLSDVGSVCVWIAPKEPEEVAATVASWTLQSDWEFESRAN